MSYTNFTTKSNLAVWKHSLQDGKDQTAICRKILKLLLVQLKVSIYTCCQCITLKLEVQPLPILPEQAQQTTTNKEI